MLAVLLPVRAEGGEREHRNPHRGELDGRDEFAAQLAEHPLIKKVAGGVHWNAGQQQQQVSSRQIRDEDVGDAPHSAVSEEYLHQNDVTQQAHSNDD